MLRLVRRINLSDSSEVTENPYEEADAVEKYVRTSTRTRTLNVPEAQFVDHYQVWDRKVLVVGGGVGRVPAQLTIFRNDVTSVDSSAKMTESARLEFPSSRFGSLKIELMDARSLGFEDQQFDVTLFPMNGVDYLPTLDDRGAVFSEMARVTKVGGVVAFTSTNILPYIWSPKIPPRARSLGGLNSQARRFHNWSVVGGVQWRSRSSHVIASAIAAAPLQFDKFFYDYRNLFERRFLACSDFWGQLYFPHLMFSFRRTEVSRSRKNR